MRKALYLLGQLSDADVEWMIANDSRLRLAPGAVLIREGQPIDALYLLLQGALDISYAETGGNKIIRLGAGEVVGERSFLDERPPSDEAWPFDQFPCSTGAVMASPFPPARRAARGGP